MSLTEIIGKIKPIDQEILDATQEHLNSLTKPLGSLGVLEDIGKQVAAIYGVFKPELTKKKVVIMAGDHGVAEEDVSCFPQEVTYQMVRNFINGGAGINVLARHAGAEIVCVDIGVKVDMHDLPDLVNKKVAYGTQNMTKGPAMTRSEAEQAIMVGVEIVKDLVEKEGITLVAPGDMGIANTTSSSAIIAALSGLSVDKVVGRGSGIDNERLKIKIKAIEKALTVNKPDKQDGLDILAKVGGLEIAGMTGVILGAAAYRIPVIIDGFNSTAAALIAATIAPLSRQYMIGSHLSAEPGHKYMLAYLELQPMLTMNLRLGEATGSALVMSMVDAAIKILREMATFEEAGVASGNS
ncbi:nicotinate-nucleotide--dimethylbenzimidazole phosphoribosyltransferase [Heliorestis acidaminivorans]|uniref:Nicotinate-nucleotide--dimethylbenzimidazole phosphoribosyltransferase n=1 Tax=Heliorestis acidaminivorans TaxID=553427 RepID=A0A6I0F2H3_9FIRM|nr:nicotinate-nucleotide--dimethylbenzimidazole phosphoribosyltransferase [Heliorestis acidaminivorans]KAB2954191.1 nicotinate-nucleotide--dimethylbenzimidazole phosphoribosyltransferase [Heliorestis acidaminivorans]